MRRVSQYYLVNVKLNENVYLIEIWLLGKYFHNQVLSWISNWKQKAYEYDWGSSTKKIVENKQLVIYQAIFYLVYYFFHFLIIISSVGWYLKKGIGIF